MINSWSIYDNSCSKKIISVIRAIRLNPLLKKNLCPSVVSVGEYSCYSSYSCSRNKSVLSVVVPLAEKKPVCSHGGGQTGLTQ